MALFLKLTTLVLALVIQSGPSFALTCLPANFADLMSILQKDDEPHLIVLGRFSASGETREVAGVAIADYVFAGRILTKRGLSEPQTFGVEARTLCLDDPCTGFPDGQRMRMTYLTQRDDVWIYSGDLCNGDEVDPSDLQVRIILACLRQGACSTRQLSRYARIKGYGMGPSTSK